MNLYRSPGYEPGPAPILAAPQCAHRDSNSDCWIRNPVSYPLDDERKFYVLLGIRTLEVKIMYEITEWDGTVELVTARFVGRDVYITYLEGEQEVHRVDTLHFWFDLEPVRVESN